MSEEATDRLLKAIQAIAISPAAAKELVQSIEHKAGTSRSTSRAARRKTAERVVAYYAKLAATTGAATALTGVIPGIGTTIALVGGATADTAVSIKLQVDMCTCLARVYGHDIDSVNSRHLAFYVALGGALEEGGRQAAVQLGTKAGVRMAREYLKGATLQVLKEMLKKVGIIFTRKALEKAIPFGIGVVIGGSSNYLLTKYVGAKASAHFELDADTPQGEGEAEPV